MGTMDWKGSLEVCVRRLVRTDGSAVGLQKVVRRKWLGLVGEDSQTATQLRVYEKHAQCLRHWSSRGNYTKALTIVGTEFQRFSSFLEQSWVDCTQTKRISKLISKNV